MTISIITATYNCAKTIGNTLESVLSQTWNDYEYIVVDGASTDGTLDIISSYAERFQGRLRYISETDESLYEAMNKGLRMASGEVVGILNADDFYSSDDILALVASAMEDEECDGIYGDVHYVDKEDTTKVVRYYSSRIFRPWLMRFGFMPAHPSFYCRKSVYDQYGVYDTSFRVAADFELLLRMFHKGHIRTRYIRHDFVTMRRGGISTSGWASHRQIMKDHLRGLKKNGILSNRFILSLRYIYKVWEVATSKLKR